MIEPSHGCAQRARVRPRRKRARRRVRLDVVEDGGDWSRLRPVEPLIDRIARIAADHLPPRPSPAAATLALSSDARVRALNRRWRGQDKPTNVLSFPAPPSAAPGSPFLGDIVVASETLFRESAEADIEPSHHFQHLVVHGLLHLVGYDHESERDADVMEGLEIRILGALGIADPYAERKPRVIAGT
jgi:probable rRNA maturation factor